MVDLVASGAIHTEPSSPFCSGRCCKLLSFLFAVVFVGWASVVGVQIVALYQTNPLPPLASPPPSPSPSPSAPACAETPTQCGATTLCAPYIYCVYTTRSDCQTMPTSCHTCAEMGYIYCMHDRLRDLLSHMDATAPEADVKVPGRAGQNKTAVDVLTACCRFWERVDPFACPPCRASLPTLASEK